MEEELLKECQRYIMIDYIINKKTEEVKKLYNNFKKTKVGKFYLSLNASQKQVFTDIYSNADFTKYNFCQKDIIEYKKMLKEIETKILNSSTFPFDSNYAGFYITDNIDIYNVLTGTSTKKLDLSMTLKNNIIYIMSKTIGFSDNYTVEDIPLISVIKKRLNTKNMSLEQLQYLISKEVDKIHSLDNTNKTYKSTDIDINSKRQQLQKEIEAIKNSNSKHKDLLLEETLAVHYELEIISGKRVTALYEEINKLDEKTKEQHFSALIKAYYNLTNLEFRKQSGYFGNYCDILYAEFATANEKINQKILDMKRK